MGILFDQNTITKNYENKIFENGIQEGREEGMIHAFVSMVKDGIITIDYATKKT